MSVANEPTVETPAAVTTIPAETPTSPAPIHDKSVDPPATNGATEPLTREALTLPEGFTADDPSLTKFLETMNNGELSPKDRANALIGLQADLMQQVSERGNEQWEELKAKWADETEKDPVIGGEKLPERLAGVQKLIDKYSVTADGKPDPAFANSFRELMDLTAMGNNPVMIRFLHNVAKDLAVEGGPVAAGTPTVGEANAAQLIYPNQGKQ